MSDLISRQAVENITWEEPSYSDPLNVLTEIREKVRALPSVENKGEWIPVSERLPEKSSNYWCTFGGTYLTGIDYYVTESDAKELFEDWEECVGWQSRNVIAWMPLPEPYKPESVEVNESTR